MAKSCNLFSNLNCYWYFFIETIIAVVRNEVSRSFLEKELKNPNCPPYTKEIISTVLKETSGLNVPAGSQTNISTSSAIEMSIPAKEHTNAPSNLMQCKFNKKYK